MKHVHIVSYFRKKLCMVVNGLRQIIFWSHLNYVMIHVFFNSKDNFSTWENRSLWKKPNYNQIGKLRHYKVYTANSCSDVSSLNAHQNP